MSVHETTDYGFRWGPVRVERVCVYRGTHVLRVLTDAGQSVEIQVSEKGHSVRVWRGAKEMK